MAKDEEKKTVTMDVEALNALVSAQVRAAVAEERAKASVDADDFAKAMRSIRGQDKPADPIRYEECESPITGSTFRAKIMSSKSSPLGRVIDLEDYVWPRGIDVPQSQGGLMPDEYVPMMQAPDLQANQALKTKYDAWLYWEFQLVDLREFASGKLFSRYILRSEADARRAGQQAAIAAAATAGA